MNKLGKAPLEQIFDTPKSRVLDHLITMKPFDYTIDELSDILEIPHIEILNILEELSEYDLVTKTEKETFKISENDKTLALHKFIFEIASSNLDKLLASRNGDKQNE